MKQHRVEHATPGSRASSTGAAQPDPLRRAPQMATSCFPSPLPPNHAARNSPGFVSTMVEAWQEENGARSKMNSARDAAAMGIHARRSMAGTLGIGVALAVYRSGTKTYFDVARSIAGRMNCSTSAKCWGYSGCRQSEVHRTTRSALGRTIRYWPP